MIIAIVIIDKFLNKMTSRLFHLIVAEKYIPSSVITMSEELLLKKRGSY